jgi:hypothetical protein
MEVAGCFKGLAGGQGREDAGESRTWVSGFSQGRVDSQVAARGCLRLGWNLGNPMLASGGFGLEGAELLDLVSCTDEVLRLCRVTHSGGRRSRRR